MKTKDDLIREISSHSKTKENEELLRFLEENNLYGTRDATEDQLRDFLWRG